MVVTQQALSVGSLLLCVLISSTELVVKRLFMDPIASVICPPSRDWHLFFSFSSKNYFVMIHHAMSPRLFRKSLFLLLGLTVTIPSLFSIDTVAARPFSVSPSLHRGGAAQDATTATMDDPHADHTADSDAITHPSDPWDQVGGGAVNEKARRQIPTERSAAITITKSFDPLTHKAHLWHALEGLDRYPNYLARWNEHDMDQLEEVLEAQLENIRQQRRAVEERRSHIRKLVQTLRSSDHPQNKIHSFEQLLQGPPDWQYIQQHVLDPELVQAIFQSPQFVDNPPPLEKVLAGQIHVDLDVGRLTRIMDEAMYDVFTFPLFRPTFCALLRDYVRTLATVGRTNPFFAELRLGLRPVDLDILGLSWVNDLLFHLILRPIARQLFEQSESLAELDWRQGYVAAYAAKPMTDKPRNQLVTHTDDSEVTLNIGLGDNFEGGHVEFRGLRGTAEEGELIDDFQPVEGRALIHAGRHFHDVTPVTKGDRYALIVWARSWRGVRATTCPCCWLNRRKDTNCVCGARWN